MNCRRWLRSLCGGLLLACASSAAAAPDAGPPPAAKQAFSDGKAAFERGEYEAALQLFQRANLIAPAPSLNYNIGMAYERLGRWDESALSFERYLASMETPQTDADREFQNNLRARALANRERARRATTVPTAPLIEPPQPYMVAPSQPYMVAPSAYPGVYGLVLTPPLTHQQRIDKARHHRVNAIVLMAIGSTLLAGGVSAIAVGTTLPFGDPGNGLALTNAQIGTVFGGASAAVVGVPLLIPGIVSFLHWDKELKKELKQP